MYKLVILIEPQEDHSAFDDLWPQFLAHAEDMPGLLREATGRVDRVLHGTYQAEMIHELFFDSLEAASQALASPQGQAAGGVLQSLTGGRVTLLLCDHHKDEIENIQRYKKGTKNDSSTS